MKQSGVHTKGAIDLYDVIKNAKDNANFPKAGAIALFIGVVRGETSKGEKVSKLELEAYEEKADDVLSQICTEFKGRQGITDVQIHHLLGEFSVGEDLLYVSVAGDHRKNVFPALEEAVERYKREAPIFKKEHITGERGESNAYWVSERESR